MNLNQVTLPAVDVAEAAGFYRRLGFRLIVDALPRYVRFECPDGESTLSPVASTSWGAAISLAGFQVSTTGRFWVSTEDGYRRSLPEAVWRVWMTSW